MFKNQYVVSNMPCSIEYEPSFKWKELYFYLGKNADNYSSSRCIIIGKFVNAFDNSLKPQQIAHELSKCSSVSDVIDYSNKLAGRFVLFFDLGDDLLVITDACGFKRALFFDESISNKKLRLITSSEKFVEYLFGEKLFLSSDIENLINDERYKKRESPWYGLTSYDNRFKFLLPNHYLLWNGFSTHRMHLPDSEYDSKFNKRIIDDMLTNIVSGFAKNYKIIQPLTAGIDSRLILAAGKQSRLDINYYVFSRNSKEHEDVRVPLLISRILAFDFNVYSPPDLDDDFIKLLQSRVLGARILPKTSNIYYHFCNTPPGFVNLNGNGAEIFRAFYGISNIKFKPKSLAFLDGAESWDLLIKRITSWYQNTNAQDFADKNKISICDLFYWEQRMAIWGSLYPLEQDIAIDEVSPFNCRSLIAIMLKVPATERAAPSFKYCLDTINRIEPSISSVPVNPDSSSSNLIIKLSKRYTLVQLILKKIRSVTM